MARNGGSASPSKRGRRKPGTQPKAPDAGYVPVEPIENYQPEDMRTLRACEIRFCELYMSGVSYSEAFRQTHATDGLASATVAAYAARLAETPRVQTYMAKIMKETEGGTRHVHVHVEPSVNDTSPIIELQRAMEAMDEESLNITPRGQMKKLELIYWYSMTSGKFAAATGAVKCQSELAGFLTQKHEISVKSLDGATDTDLNEMAELARRELVELGLDPETGVYSEMSSGMRDMVGALVAITQKPEQPKRPAGRPRKDGRPSGGGTGNMGNTAAFEDSQRKAMFDDDEGVDWDD